MKTKIFQKVLATATLLFIIALPLFSQQITLKGVIVDEKTDESLEFVNVILLKPDSSIVTGCNSGENGEFLLTVNGTGDYFLSVSYLGYRTCIIKLDNLTASIDLDKVFIEQEEQLLNEVVIQGSSRINKVDRQIILPTQIQVKSSNSGYELLNNMMLPGLRIDPIQNAISAIGGGEVQIRINNIIASTTQVKALRPANVLRVEYIDDPGARYGDENVSAVINFIVKKKESGYTISADLQNAPFVGFANDLLSLRANHKKSEFGLDYFMSWRDYKKRYNVIEEKYTFPTKEVQRNMKGIEQPFGYLDHSIEAFYNLTETDKYVFNISFKDFISNSPNNDFSYQISYNDPDIPATTSRLHAVMKSNLPSLDVYYQRQLPNKQSVTFNTVGTYIQSKYERSYFEDKGLESSPEFAYTTDGKKYSFIGEGLYEKEFKPFKLTSGLKYSQSHTENVYKGSTSTTAELNNSNLYVFGQLQGRLNKINYLIGLGLSRSSFEEKTNDYVFYTFQPNVSLSYSFLKTSFLRYRFSITPTLPSLSALSDVTQDLESFRVRQGNPDLKPYRRYRNNLFYQFRKNLVSASLSETYDYLKNPIMEDIFRKDDNNSSTFIYTFNNQKKYQRLATLASLTIGPIKDIVSFEVEGGVNKYFSDGNNYSHKHSNWFVGCGLEAYYKNWIFYTFVNTRESSLSGETISMGEAVNNIGVFYQIKNCRVGLSMLYPYSSEYKVGSELLSNIAYSKSWTHIKENGHMLILNFAWSVDYGKKHQSGRKTLSNSDSDSGIVK